MDNKKTRVSASVPYEPDLDSRLRDPEYAIAYFKAALEGASSDPDTLGQVLSDIARAYDVEIPTRS